MALQAKTAKHGRNLSESRRREFLSRLRFQRGQFAHFCVCTILPSLAVIGWMAIELPRIIDLVLLGGMWFIVGCLGVSLGLHRYFTHRSFSTTNLMTFVFAVCGLMACQGPIAYWVSVHRCHHKYSDTPFDPHTPVSRDHSIWRRLIAFLHGHIFWSVNHDVPNPSVFAPDLKMSSIVRWCDHTYWAWALLGIALPGCIAFLIDNSYRSFVNAVVYGGLLRIVLVNQITWAVNSLGHTVGSSPNENRDNSRNLWIMAIPSFGEAWHNNHHAAPSSPRFGKGWYQFDIGWGVLCVLASVGIVWDLNGRRRVREN